MVVFWVVALNCVMLPPHKHRQPATQGLLLHGFVGQLHFNVRLLYLQFVFLLKHILDLFYSFLQELILKCSDNVHGGRNQLRRVHADILRFPPRQPTSIMDGIVKGKAKLWEFIKIQ
jgi:hypothetical protein